MKKFYINMYGLAAFAWSGVVYVTHHSYWWIVLLMGLYTFLVVFQPTLKWEPRDTWVGLFHDKVDGTRQWHLDTTVSAHHRFRFFLVVIPCLPLIWDWVIVTHHLNEGLADKAIRTKKTVFHFLLFWQ